MRSDWFIQGVIEPSCSVICQDSYFSILQHEFDLVGTFECEAPQLWPTAICVALPGCVEKAVNFAIALAPFW